ncbi:MAG: hypothetical protein Rhirs2KO_17400 [Rhizobiaceae bacterium]
MKRETTSRHAAAAAVVLSAALVAGCSSTMQPRAGAVRSTGETAPADLQLLCASEAATRLGTTESVLPVSSMAGPNGTYQVNLAVGSGQAVCFVDNNGIVQSVTMV